MSRTKISTVFSRGLVRENPLLVLLLGTCPALAVTTSLMNGLGMGLAATFVLMCSNVVISLLRKAIPDKVRIPTYIVIIASFVTILQFLLEAYVPALNDTLGIFIPLITVNCVILGRAEAFAGKSNPFISLIDGIGMGLGFTAALTLIGGIREILGNGSIFDVTIPFIGGDNMLQPILVFILPPGGFFVYGILIALANKLSHKLYDQKPEEALEDPVCVVEDAADVDCVTCRKCGISELRAAYDPPKESNVIYEKPKAAIEPPTGLPKGTGITAPETLSGREDLPKKNPTGDDSQRSSVQTQKDQEVTS